MNGQILALGGGGSHVFGGSGGCIRLVAPAIEGNGTLNVTGAGSSTHAGRIRIDTYDRNSLALTYLPNNSTNVSQGTFVVARVLPEPTLEIVDVGGLGTGEGLAFPENSVSTQPVSIAASNFGEPVNIEITLKPTHGPAEPVVTATIPDNDITAVDVPIPANTPFRLEVVRR